jgi:DNA polymerase
VADSPPQWLADSARYLRQQVEREGELLIPAKGARLQKEKSEKKSAQAPPTEHEGVEVHSGRLEEFRLEICNCQKCPLGLTRTNFVFGVGNPGASLMFIGEAPGRDEDLKGEPFVGRAGQLLNKIIESIGFVREDVYIGNILKCRPPDNRDPLPEEVDKCEPYLQRQIDLIDPAVICALGRIAAQTLLRTRATLGKMREKIHTYQGRPLIVTYHPAALLRNPHWKKPTWEDIQLLRKVHDEEIGL